MRVSLCVRVSLRACACLCVRARVSACVRVCAVSNFISSTAGALVTQSLRFSDKSLRCDPTDCSLLGSSVHGDSPGKSTGVGCHFLF